MKRYTRLFKVRPTMHLCSFLIVLGLLILPVITHANDLDNEIKVESWMVTPFETEFAEFEIQLESWMVTPFEMEFAEFEIPLENWMTDTWL